MAKRDEAGTSTGLAAADVMSSPVVTVGPDTPLSEVARIFVERGIGGVPVVDTDGGLLGILTEGDMLLKGAGAPGGIPRLAMFIVPRGAKHLSDQLKRVEGTNAGEVMTRKVITATEDTPLRELAAVMCRERISRIPILSDGTVVGIVTRANVLNLFLRSDDDIAADVRRVVGTRLDPDRFTVSSEAGVVRFEGKLERRSDVRLAEVFAHSVDGVMGVDVSGLTFERDDLSW